MDQHLLQKRLSKTRFIGRIIARLPFIRCVILNGSLAQGKSKESSDIDILIIAKTGRVFSARFFVNAFATLLGLKRSKDEGKSHAGKFCFNYFLTQDFLMIPTGRGEEIDHYCADNYSQSKFIAGDVKLYEEFMWANQKLFEKYGYKVTSHKLRVTSSSQMSSRAEQSGVERSINITIKKDSSTSLGMTIIGDWFESWAKQYQIKKIESDPRTKKYPDLIVYNDRELRFHPPKAE